MSRTLHFKLCCLSVSTKTECISIVENFGNKFYDTFSKSNIHISVTFKSQKIIAWISLDFFFDITEMKKKTFLLHAELR